MYSNREFYEMVRCYILSDEKLKEAQKMYVTESTPRLKMHGVLDPKRPNIKTILAVNQRLVEYGKFSLPSEEMLLKTGSCPQDAAVNTAPNKADIKTEPVDDNHVQEVLEDASTSNFANMYEHIKIEVVENELVVNGDVNKFEDKSQSNPNSKKVTPKIKKNRNKYTESKQKLNKIGEAIYCKVCSLKFLRANALKTHMSLHDEKRKFKCEKCTYRFFWLKDLVLHQRKHSIAKYICDLCGCKSKYKNSLAKHFFVHHKDIMPALTKKKTNPKKDATKYKKNLLNKTDIKKFYYECDICKFRSFMKNIYEKHSKLHDKKRKFSCKICLYRFVSKQALGRHMLKHSDAKFKCKICDREYKYKDHLILHMEEHEGNTYTCNDCGQMCKSKSLLKTHITTNHRYVYNCDICMQVFTKNNSYIDHMKRHLRESENYEL